MNKFIDKIKDFFKNFSSITSIFSSNTEITEDFNEGTSASDDVLNEFSEAYLNNTFGLKNDNVENVKKEED